MTSQISPAPVLICSMETLRMLGAATNVGCESRIEEPNKGPIHLIGANANDLATVPGIPANVVDYLNQAQAIGKTVNVFPGGRCLSLN